MDTFTHSDLMQLADATGDCLLSLYMPTERSGSKVQQNRIRFKNLIDEAFQSLGEVSGNASSNIEAVRDQLDELQKQESDDDWWQHQSEGLAIFLDGKAIKRWRIPLAFENLCMRSDSFHVRPLCRMLQNDGRFYILAVSLNEVRLFLGTKTSVSEVEAADLPKDLRSALNIDEYVSSLQSHSTSPGGEAMFHGHGGSDPDVKKRDEIKQYFHHIEDALNNFFGVERVPLVFAGVQYLFPIFQEACDYTGLVEEPVTGNPEELSGEQLHDRAWPLVEKRFDADRASLIDRYGTAASQQLGTDDLDTILAAAQQGQVETLLTVEGVGFWTRESSDSSDAQSDKVATGEDLVNAAVIDTLRNSGNVYSVKEGQLDHPVAAILRYPQN